MKTKSKYSSIKFFSLKEEKELERKNEIKYALYSRIGSCLATIKKDLELITNEGKLPPGWEIKKDFLDREVLYFDIVTHATPPTFLDKVHYRVTVLNNRVRIVFVDKDSVIKEILLNHPDVIKRFGMFCWNGCRIKVL